jgi:hypothetical protein
VNDTGADGMLYLLRANPTLLPEAPTNATGEQMEHRRHDEVHACLRCGQRAQCAFVAHTDIGNRWLDLCAACSHWLQANLTPDDRFDLG